VQIELFFRGKMLKMVKTSNKALILGSNYDTIFIFLRTLKKYFELKLRVLVKNKNMNKTTLSPIIAGTMNWGVWDKT
jgi:hypothetical protein